MSVNPKSISSADKNRIPAAHESPSAPVPTRASAPGVVDNMSKSPLAKKLIGSRMAAAGIAQADHRAGSAGSPEMEELLSQRRVLDAKVISAASVDRFLRFGTRVTVDQPSQEHIDEMAAQGKAWTGTHFQDVR
jgi:hypothetical protein